MLAIGSIVYLKEGNQKIMILNRGAIVEEAGTNTLYDYSGCAYPNGLNPNQVFYFNDENVDSIILKGYSDEDEKRFNVIYQEWFKEKGNSFKKGVVHNSIK